MHECLEFSSLEVLASAVRHIDVPEFPSGHEVNESREFLSVQFSRGLIDSGWPYIGTFGISKCGVIKADFRCGFTHPLHLKAP